MGSKGGLGPPSHQFTKIHAWFHHGASMTIRSLPCFLSTFPAAPTPNAQSFRLLWVGERECTAARRRTTPFRFQKLMFRASTTKTMNREFQDIHLMKAQTLMVVLNHSQSLMITYRFGIAHTTVFTTCTFNDTGQALTEAIELARTDCDVSTSTHCEASMLCVCFHRHIKFPDCRVGQWGWQPKKSYRQAALHARQGDYDPPPSTPAMPPKVALKLSHVYGLLYGACSPVKARPSPILVAIADDPPEHDAHTCQQGGHAANCCHKIPDLVGF